MSTRTLHSGLSRTRSGFTLIEVMFATLLLGIVGMGILTFMSAFASGIQVRQSINDAAIDSSLAARRLAAVAPGFTYVLEADQDRVAIWLSDSVPSRTVHRSEVGIVRYDATRDRLLFETLSPAALAGNPMLDAELPFTGGTDFVGALDEARVNGDIVSQILAERVETAWFTTAGVPSGHATLHIEFTYGSAQVAISPAFTEPPVE